MKPENIEETTEGGLPIRDLFAFAGVRAIIGDPNGKLMQDEVADRIQKLVHVLQNIVGLVDALDVIDGSHKGSANTAMRRARMMILETVEESMPEWNQVLEAIHKVDGWREIMRANAIAMASGRARKPKNPRDQNQPK